MGGKRDYWNSITLLLELLFSNQKSCVTAVDTWQSNVHKDQGNIFQAAFFNSFLTTCDRNTFESEYLRLTFGHVTENRVIFD